MKTSIDSLEKECKRDYKNGNMHLNGISGFGCILITLDAMAVVVAVAAAVAAVVSIHK